MPTEWRACRPPSGSHSYTSTWHSLRACAERVADAYARSGSLDVWLERREVSYPVRVELDAEN